MELKKPSVTELIKLLDVPALMSWANRIGLEGISLKDYRKKLAGEGINVHKLIENDFKNIETYDNEKFKSFKSKYEVVAVEPKIECEHYTGRSDVLLSDKAGLICLFDFKNTDVIYFEQVIQLVAYKRILKPDKIGIVNTTSFNETVIELTEYQEKQYTNILSALVLIYNSKQRLNIIK